MDEMKSSDYPETYEYLVKKKKNFWRLVEDGLDNEIQALYKEKKFLKIIEMI